MASSWSVILLVDIPMAKCISDEPFTYVFLKQYLGSFAKDLFYRLGIFSPWISEQSQVRATLTMQRAVQSLRSWGGEICTRANWCEVLLMHKASWDLLYCFFSGVMNFYILLKNGFSYSNYTKYLTRKCKKSLLLERNFRFWTSKYERVYELFAL